VREISKMSMDMLKNHLHSTVDRINDNKNNRRMKNIGISESKVVKKSHERNPKNSVNYIGSHVYELRVLTCCVSRRYKENALTWAYTYMI
jgi:hypothetical protein